MIKNRKGGIRFEEGSGNVFADLDLEQPEQEFLKARGLTQAKAGVIDVIDTPMKDSQGHACEG